MQHNKEKYKYVKKMIDKDLVNYLTTFSLNTKKNTKEWMGDEQVPQSHSAHPKDEIIYKHLLHFLHPRMEEETGLKLQTSYCYNRIYFPGSELKKHIDRPACEISISLTLNFSYADEKYRWPLCMGDTPIVIESGDGLIYKGCEIEHWRPIFTQPTPSYHHQAFLHYVDKNGPYKDLKEEIYE